MRLIDADKLPKYTGYALSASDVAIAVENAPTVDAVPVVRGEWIPFEGETGVEAFGYKEYTTLGFRCSVCHAHIDVSEQYFRYCPMCGSKMDGERKGGDE